MTTAEDRGAMLKPASLHTCQANAALGARLDFSDDSCFDDARRGFIDTLPNARIETADGRESVPLSELREGDIACVAAGEPVPADGVLLDGPAWLEESLLTGEHGAVRRDAGETIYAGTVNREAPARLQVACTGPQTRLSQLTRLVEDAQSHRPRLARMADRVGSRFVVGLLCVAALVYLGWRVYDPSRAFEVTLALLVISCPCALSLAVPTALASAHGALARIGVLATRADALDTLATATDLVFDKTGTLSDERPVLAGVDTFDGFQADAALAIAAALERDAGHPFAAAFAHADAGLAVAGMRAVPGSGVEGAFAPPTAPPSCRRRWTPDASRRCSAGPGAPPTPSRGHGSSGTRSPSGAAPPTRASPTPKRSPTRTSIQPRWTC